MAPRDTKTFTDRSAKITTIGTETSDNDHGHLEPRTQYEVQVRAKNGEGDSTFDRCHQLVDIRARHDRPRATEAGLRRLKPVVTLEVEENTRAGQNVGSDLEATDADSNRLTYSLEGPGKDSFTINSVIRADTDEVAPMTTSRERELLGDGEGGRRAEEGQQRRRQVGDHRLVTERPTSSRPRPGRRGWRGYPARRTACASRGTSPRTRGLPSPTTTCSTPAGSRLCGGPNGIARTGARSSRG